MPDPNVRKRTPGSNPMVKILGPGERIDSLCVSVEPRMPRDRGGLRGGRRVGCRRRKRCQPSPEGAGRSPLLRPVPGRIEDYPFTLYGAFRDLFDGWGASVTMGRALSLQFYRLVQWVAPPSSTQPLSSEPRAIFLICGWTKSDSTIRRWRNRFGHTKTK